jgi:hypothetical protein
MIPYLSGRANKPRSQQAAAIQWSYFLVAAAALSYHCQQNLIEGKEGAFFRFYDTTSSPKPT